MDFECVLVKCYVENLQAGSILNSSEGITVLDLHVINVLFGWIPVHIRLKEANCGNIACAYCVGQYLSDHPDYCF